METEIPFTTDAPLITSQIHSIRKTTLVSFIGVIVTLLLLVLGLIGGYYYASHFQPQIGRNITKIETTISPASDKYAGWQTYQDSLNNFSFRYPQSWKIVPDTTLATCGESYINLRTQQGYTLTISYNYNNCAYGGTEPATTANFEIINIAGTNVYKDYIDSCNENPTADQSTCSSKISSIQYTDQVIPITNASPLYKQTQYRTGSPYFSINNRLAFIYFQFESEIALTDTNLQIEDKNLDKVIQSLSFRQDLLPIPPSGSNLFASPDLGVAFFYVPVEGDESISTKEVQNTVYVYSAKSPYTQGQSIQVLSKDPDETLEQALEKIIVSAGDSLSDCSIVLESPSYPNNVSYQTGKIEFSSTNQDPSSPFDHPRKCPIPYTMDSGLAYFITDSKHPEKLLFLSIGQYDIFSNVDEKHSWQDTIVFI